jgi:hypothetical protein
MKRIRLITLFALAFLIREIIEICEILFSLHGSTFVAVPLKRHFERWEYFSEEKYLTFPASLQLFAPHSFQHLQR